MSKPQAPDLAALLTDYYEGRNAGAWSRNAKIGNLKNFAEAINFLTERCITTLEDLEAHFTAQSERAEAINTSMKAKSARLNELKEGAFSTKSKKGGMELEAMKSVSRQPRPCLKNKGCTKW